MYTIILLLDFYYHKIIILYRRFSRENDFEKIFFLLNNVGNVLYIVEKKNIKNIVLTRKDH